MANTQRLVIVVLAFLFAILFVSMLYERSNYDSLRTSIELLTANQAKMHGEERTPVKVTDEL